MVDQQTSKKQEDVGRKVHITATYTTTGDEKHLVVELSQTLQAVVTEAYAKLGETRRDQDTFFTADDNPRVDLRPHLSETLAALAERHVGVKVDEHGKATLALDIDTTPGGA